MERKRFNVGVYDSGIGGMTLLAECKKLLPFVNFYYYGDNENAPYGQKSKEEIFALADAVLSVFNNMGVDAVVIACNTVTTTCIEKLRRKYAFPIIGTEPAVRPTKNCKRVLTLATTATLQSEEYQKLLKERAGESVCFSPINLVAEIEKYAPNFEKVGIADHLPPLVVDGVVLGCTHYVYLRKEISAYYNAPYFDGNEGTAKRLKNVLFSAKNRNFEVAESGGVFFLGASKKTNQSLFLKVFHF